MALARLFGPSPAKRAAHLAYITLVEQARRPAFYRDYAVPDTLDGRFEMIVLHAFLILHRLRGLAEAQRFSQALFDVLFADMDRALREMGTGDLSVGKQVKLMATNFYGRIAAYQDGLDASGDLELALTRNLYGTITAPPAPAIAAIAAWMRQAVAALANQPAASIIAGTLEFPPFGD